MSVPEPKVYSTEFSRKKNTLKEIKLKGELLFRPIKHDQCNDLHIILNALHNCANVKGNSGIVKTLSTPKCKFNHQKAYYF